MFDEEGNVFNKFIRPQVCPHCVLVSITECEHNFWLFTRKLHLLDV